MGRRRLVAKKTLLGSAVIPLYVFAVQAALSGRLYVAGAAACIATGLFAAYEYLGLRAIPLDLEELRELSEQIGEAAREASGGLNGVRRDPETGRFVSPEESNENQQQDGGAT